MYLQSGWGNWKLLVSFLHQHKPFTKLTHANTFPATQISENSGKISDIFWSFLEVQAVSNTQHQPEPNSVQITSLWARTPVDQDWLWPQLSNSSRSAADNAGFLLPSRRTSPKRTLMFSFKPLFLQNFSPPLKFPFLFQLQKAGTCFLNSLTGVSSRFQVQFCSSNHLQSRTLNSKLVLVKAETRNKLFLFCSMFTQHLV